MSPGRGIRTRRQKMRGIQPRPGDVTSVCLRKEMLPGEWNGIKLGLSSGG